MFELGIATGLGKAVAVYASEAFCTETIVNVFGNKERAIDELWLMAKACKLLPAPCPRVGLERAIESLGLLWLKPCYDSPLEKLFAEEWVNQALHLLWPLGYQHPIKGGAYRLDFAYEPVMLGIELDGYTYHSDRDAFTKDRQRQREIEAMGWSIIRFSGDELRQDIAGCVRETARRLDIEKRKRG